MKKIKKYFVEVAQESKKVTWPTRQQTVSKTVLVIGVSAVVALYIGGLDYIFQQMMTALFAR